MSKRHEPKIAGLTELDVAQQAKQAAYEHMRFNRDWTKGLSDLQIESIESALLYYAEFGAQQAFRNILSQ